MGRNKRGGAPRGPGGQVSRSRKPLHFRGNHLGSSFVSPPGDNNNSFPSPISLQQEARNTERHHAWNSDLRLRHTQVAFVSAGASDAEQDRSSIETQYNPPQTPEKQATPAASPAAIMAQMSLEEEPKMDKALDSSHSALRENSKSHQDQREGHIDRIVVPGDDLFFVDTSGTGWRPRTRLSPPQIRRASLSAGSDSSEEVILFKGRKQTQHQSRPSYPSALDYNPRYDDHKDKASRLGVQARCAHNSFITIEDSIRENPSVLARQADDRSFTPPTIDSRLNSKTRRRKKRVGTRRQEGKEKEDEILKDYIENIKYSHGGDDLMASNGVNGRELGGTDNDEWQDETGDSAVERHFNTMLGDSTGWDSDDMRDLEDLSTSGEVLGFIETIISKRERPSGLQYLVIWEGYTIDDARWVPSTSLTMYGADEHIRQYETENEVLGQWDLQSEGSEDSSADDDQISRDVEEDLEDLEDERDLWERRTARMTDEQIARTLAKQEEFGLGSDELLLLDGNADIQMTGNGRRSISCRAHVKGKMTRSFRDSLKVPNQEGPYDGFDFMDHSRPSMLNNVNGRHGALPFDLSDTDLKETLQSAWTNDRNKKKARKQEREELRAQGLLTKKNKPNLKAKYGEGMTLKEVKDEIRDFLVSSAESLPLPPMDQKDRKMVHEIAHVFNLRSKSVGSGKNRFPVLYKTSRTIRCSEDTIIDIYARLSQRRFFPRMDKKGRRGPPVGGKARRGGFTGAAVSYRDGEIVGATAPELGIENKGRAMLERMGWSTGTALGALNNKGITQPIAHTVRTTRAGLG